MGESVKIKDLLYNMIKLSGFTIKDDKNPNGDIDIKIIGLRPGEKLYEELLIGENPVNTSNHPKTRKTNDPYIPFDQLEESLSSLKNLLYFNKVKEVKEMLNKLLKLYQSNSDIVDHIYVEQLSVNKYKQDLSIGINTDNKVIKINKK